MTATPPVTPAIKFELVRHEGNKSIIRLSTGEEYEFTVHSKTGTGSWKDITKTKDWKDLAEHVSQLFLESTEHKAFEKAELQLSGEFANVETEAPKERPVTIVSAEVAYKDERGTVKSKKFGKELQSIPNEAHQKITETLGTIGRDFKSIKPLSSSPRTETEIPPPSLDTKTPSPLEEQIIEKDPRVEICKGRDTVNIGAHPGAEYNLAAQLKHMEKRGNSDYSVKMVDAIAGDLRNEVATHIVIFDSKLGKKGNGWDKGAKFESVLQALRTADEKADPALETARAKIIPKITASSLTLLLKDDASKINPDTKIKLTQLYSNYLLNNGKIHGEVFFKAFVEIHENPLLGDNFQIVVIDDKDKATHYVTSKDKSIDTRRCAFLKYDSTKDEYLTYDRTENAPKALAKLNDSITVGLAPVRETVKGKQVIASTIPKIPVDATGRCLDKSLAYQILAKSNPSVATNDAGIELLADYLRTEAVKQINDDARDLDVEFFNALHASIMAIPAFSNENIGVEAKVASLESIEKLFATPLVPKDEIKTIREILAKGDHSSTLPADRKKLREFYASYVAKKDNYLDSAFLYVLPMIPVRAEDKKAIGEKYQCAVLSGNQLQARYPNNTEFKIGNSIFVLYDGINHYDAVNMGRGALQISRIINAQHSELLETLFERARTSTAQETKKYLLETIAAQTPKTYNALKGLIYKYDLDAYNRDPTAEVDNKKGSIHRPGTIELSHDGKKYPATEYGDFRLHQIDAAALQALLLSSMNFEAVVSAIE